MIELISERVEDSSGLIPNRIWRVTVPIIVRNGVTELMGDRSKLPILRKAVSHVHIRTPSKSTVWRTSSLNRLLESRYGQQPIIAGLPHLIFQKLELLLSISESGVLPLELAGKGFRFAFEIWVGNHRPLHPPNPRSHFSRKRLTKKGGL